MGQGRDVFDWWWRQIVSALPWLRGQERRPEDAVIIDVKQFVAEPLMLAGSVLARRGGDERFVAALQAPLRLPADLADLPAVGLRLPAVMALHRTLVLPAKAEHHLTSAIGFEIERITPFPLRDVYWSVNELKREQQELKLKLLIVPRAVVEPLLDALRQAAPEISFLETGHGHIWLAAEGARPRDPVRLGLLGLCAAIAIAMLTVPVVRQQWQMAGVDRRIVMLTAEQQELALLHRQLAKLDPGGAVAAAASQNGDALQTLAMLAGALPDGTWLNSLVLSSKEMTLAGESGNAAQLVTALAGAGKLRNPSLIGPITRAQDGGEIFSIAASTSK